MTTRTIGVLAAMAVGVAALALLARPLLPHHARLASTATTSTAAVPAGIERSAEQTVRRDLRCPTRPRPHAAHQPACGTLQVIRRQTTCTTPARCQVDLVGELRTAALAVPVALSVTLTYAAGTWRAVEVSS
jgi:hypothetical protein